MKLNTIRGRRLTVLQEKQRGIQLRRNSELVGAVEEAMVEGFNRSTGQWIGRTSQNRTLNFTDPELPGPNGQTLVGEYVNVRVTRAGPSSLPHLNREQPPSRRVRPYFGQWRPMLYALSPGPVKPPVRTRIVVQQVVDDRGCVLQTGHP
jgi:hypothetical protein